MAIIKEDNRTSPPGNSTPLNGSCSCSILDRVTFFFWGGEGGEDSSNVQPPNPTKVRRDHPEGAGSKLQNGDRLQNICESGNRGELRMSSFSSVGIDRMN